MAKADSGHPSPPVGHRSFGQTELRPGEAYRLLTHLVVPRPIALVSSVSPTGQGNLAPFSFFMVGGSHPPSVAISTVTRAARGPLSARKDTLQNILQTEEFVIHGVDYPTVTAANQASAEYPCHISEWEQLSLTALPSLMVRPSRVLESPWALECKLHQWVRHGTGPGSANYLIGEVLVFHVREDLLVAGEGLGLGGWDWVARLDGNGYARSQSDQRMELQRPQI